MAAQAPANDRASQAEAAKVGDMAQAKPGVFDKAAFIAAVRSQVEAAAPSNLDDAEKFSTSGKAEQIKNNVSGQVDQGKQQSAGPVEEAANATPDASRATDKPTAPAPERSASTQPESVGATEAVPKPAPEESTNLDHGPNTIEDQMAEAEVTDEQLANSNEPEFQDALAGKNEVKEQAQAAPAQFRAEESARIDEERGAAGPLEQAGLADMQATQGQALAGAAGSQRAATSADEEKRRAVAEKIQSIYAKTKSDVDGILGGLDAKVSAKFDSGEAAARRSFESFVGARMRAYKDRRYDGLLGKGRWLKDKFLGLPSEVNTFYDQGKRRYLAAMEQVISQVADIIGGELDKAASRVQQGKTEIDTYVASLPQQLRGVGEEAAGEISAKFDALEQDIAAKNDAMVQMVAERYIAARKSLDERIEQMQAENEGLLSGVLNVIGGVIKTILEMKAMLMSVLASVSGVVGTILKNPVDFIGKLVGAIGGGLKAFVANIGTHLKNGLVTWLTGTLGEGGIELPKTWDIKGIFSLVMQILGLTWNNIKNRLIKQVGAKAVGALESGFTLVKTLVTEGLGGLATWFITQVGNIKEMVFGALKGFLIETVITKGIEWVLSLLTPAGAFVRAVKAIVDIVKFFIDRASQIGGLLQSVLDAVSKVAGGAFGAVSAAIETTLARALPMAIGFLANLIGVGGLAKKVQDIVGKIRAPINKALDILIAKAVGWVKKVWKKGKSKLDDPKTRAARAKRAEKQGAAAINALPGSRVGRSLVGPALLPIRLASRLPKLRAFTRESYWVVEAPLQRQEATRKRDVDDSMDDESEEEILPDHTMSVVLYYKTEWTPDQRAAADAKIRALNKAASARALFKTPVKREGSARSAFEKVHGKGTVPKRMDVDHVVELQLGGEDAVSNMAPLSASVNRSFGVQIRLALSKVPTGSMITGFKMYDRVI